MSHKSKPSHVVFNADDFGMARGISEAIAQTHLNGVVNSASACVTGLFSTKNLNRAPGLCLGLHVNLTEGFPLTAAAKTGELVDVNGRFRPASQSLALESRLSSQIIQTEILAQLRRFRGIFKKRPLHMDSHQHFVYLSPVAFEAFLAVSAQEMIPIRCPKPFFDAQRLKKFMDRAVRRHGAHFAFTSEERAAELAAVFDKHPVPWRTDDLLLELDLSEASRNETLNLIERYSAKGSVEVVCHPAFLAHDGGSAKILSKEAELLCALREAPVLSGLSI